MHRVTSLPPYLVRRYHGWKATTYTDNKSWFRRLGEEGQHPRAMIISCCDSRVHVTSMFGAETGEFFIHRNIANLVPPYQPGREHHGTSAAVEYAVRVLKVAHIVIVGHSNCGGVHGCIEMCEGNAPDLEEESSFIGRWLDILRGGFERTRDIPGDAARHEALEKEAVKVSLQNLMSFPYVADAIAEGRLSLHGLWNNISEGTLEMYHRDSDTFAVI